MERIAAKWDAVYAGLEPADSKPAAVLAENTYLLPDRGLALDLACGLGGNAHYLAAAGLTVEAWDISAVAIDKLQAYADRQGLNIKARQLNIDTNCLAGMCFDVIVVSRFLDRALSDAIISALKFNGLLFYQTFTRQKVDDSGPSCFDFLLAECELLTLFSELTPVYYRDNGLLGDRDSGLRNEVQFIGQKR